MATTTERISLPKFAAAIGLAVEQVKFLAPDRAARALIVEAYVFGYAPLAPGAHEYSYSELEQTVIAMIDDPNHPNWDR